MKEINKMIDSINNDYYTTEDFIADAKTYIKALKSGRVQYRVTHVSQSGMSRDINIQSYEGTMNKGYYRNYITMLQTLGYRFSKHSWDIKVSGCGMDMLFATNYDIIHTFHRLGLINRKSCDTLAQKI